MALNSLIIEAQDESGQIEDDEITAATAAAGVSGDVGAGEELEDGEIDDETGTVTRSNGNRNSLLISLGDDSRKTNSVVRV